MRILHSPDISTPVIGAVPAASSADQERVEAVENIAKSILQRLQSIEERIKVLEQAGAATAAKADTMPAPVKSPVLITFDADAVKKGLLTKMWRYLNDQAAA